MDVVVSERDGIVIAHVEGTLDEGAKLIFDQALHSLIEKPGRRVLIDLSGSERATSAGIGSLVTLVSRANSKGSRVVLAGPRPFVHTVLRATKLDRFFDIAPTVEDGLIQLGDAVA
jgi:anti-anti-sigma factor